MPGFNRWDPGGCNCGCVQTFTVHGCDAQPYPDITVNVYDVAGGTLLASGRTDGSGRVALNWEGTGSVYVTLAGTDARFAAYGQSLTLTCGGSVVVTAQADNTTHVCVFDGDCLIPSTRTIAVTVTGPWGTLEGTASFVGGSGWHWSTSFAGQTYSLVIDGSEVTVTGPGCFSSVPSTLTCPPAFALSASWDLTCWSGSLSASE